MVTESKRSDASTAEHRPAAAPGPIVSEPAAVHPAAASSLAGWAMGTAVVALVLAAASPVWVPWLRSAPAPAPAPEVMSPAEIMRTIADRTTPMADRITALEASVQRLAAANATSAASRSGDIRSLALAGAVAQLRMATIRPTPFAVELAVVAGLAEGREAFAPALRLLAPHAATGIPTTRQLRQRLADRVAAALMAEASTDDVPLVSQMVTWFASTAPFGSGRLIHDLTMPATAAALQEAERLAADDDLPGALAAVEGLTGSASAEMQPWISAVRARMDAARATDMLVRIALAELPAAAH